MFTIKNRVAIGGERWFEPKGYNGLRLKISSLDNPQYRSVNAIIRRHLQKTDEVAGVGTKAFKIGGIQDGIDNLDDLLIENAANNLIVDWEGVGEVVDGKEVELKYTKQKAAELLKQNPMLFWAVLGEAEEIANGQEQQAKETVAKPSRRRRG